ncbi:MAG TPA: PP2C family protein-serine/threonine phosphatase [Terracidiphilus sp.]|jgi:Stage II sporulation protein E (SpoIIE)
MPTEPTSPLSLWNSTSRRNLIIFLAAVFFTFAVMGFLDDITGMGRRTPLRFLLNVMFSGLFAVCYAYFGIRLRGRFWLALAPLLVIQILTMMLLANVLPDAPHPGQLNSAEMGSLNKRLSFDTAAVTIAVTLGYIGFVMVFVSESKRSIRANLEKAVLETEMQAARQVQQLILPERNENFPGYRVDSVYTPAQQVGGDFVQILSDNLGGILIVIGDVAGKGLPAAMLVSMLIGTVRTIADETQDPARILNKLHERLIGHTDGAFSTALAAHIAHNGLVTIANAGHLSPYLDGKEILLSGALPLGVDGGGQYQETTFTLELGSRLTFETDGVVEARNQAGELFGFDRAQAISTHTAAEITEAAVNFGQQDDITVATIERLAA